MGSVNRNLSFIAFVLGLAAVIWGSPSAISAAAHSPWASPAPSPRFTWSAHSKTLRFHGNTATRSLAALDNVDDITDVNEWLAGSSRRRCATPCAWHRRRTHRPAGTVVTPTSSASSFCLGMLGTFLGMVVTLNGAVLALERTTDLHSIRSARRRSNGSASPSAPRSPPPRRPWPVLISFCSAPDRQHVGRLNGGSPARCARPATPSRTAPGMFKRAAARRSMLPEAGR